MTRSLTDEQREHIDAAIDILGPPADERDQAFREAARQVTRWEAAAVSWDRNTLKTDLVSDINKLEAAKAVLSKRHPWVVSSGIMEERAALGVDLDNDRALDAGIALIEREILFLKRAAENLPRQRRGPKGKADKDRIWRHTVEQFRRYRPGAPVADKKEYADCLYQATVAHTKTQSWRRPNDNLKEKNNGRQVSSST